MTFDWIDGSITPHFGQYCWTEIKGEQGNFYDTCSYDKNGWYTIGMNDCLVRRNNIVRYFILPIEPEIKKCPSCDGKAFILNPCPTESVTNGLKFHIECVNCELRTRRYHTEAEAIKAWNRRV